MDKIRLLEAFRDFFYHGKSKQMRTAYETIRSILGGGNPAEDFCWDDEEYLFNRLFVGPAAPAAPKVASVYLDPEKLIQGSVTKQVRDFYEAIGLCLEEAGREPEDALEFELDACRYLFLLADGVPEVMDIYREFVEGHVAVWVPQFAEQALEHCGFDTAVGYVLERLSGWIISESGVTVVSKE